MGVCKKSLLEKRERLVGAVLVNYIYFGAYMTGSSLFSTWTSSILYYTFLFLLALLCKELVGKE